MNRFGEKLRDLRKHHKITLKKLAKKLGYVTHSYINEIELGQKAPTVNLTLKVSRLFNVSTDVLLKDELDLILDKSNLSDTL